MSPLALREAEHGARWDPCRDLGDEVIRLGPVYKIIAGVAMVPEFSVHGGDNGQRSSVPPGRQRRGISSLRLSLL